MAQQLVRWYKVPVLGGSIPRVFIFYCICIQQQLLQQVVFNLLLHLYTQQLTPYINIICINIYRICSINRLYLTPVFVSILSSRTLLPNLSEVQQSEGKNVIHHLKTLFQDYKFNDQVVNFDQTGIIPTVQNLIKLNSTPQTFLHFDASLDPYDYLIATTQYKPQYYALKYPYVIKMSQNLFVLSTGQCGILFTAGQLISSANGILFDFIGESVIRYSYDQALTLFPAETALLHQFRLKNKFLITDCLDQFVPPQVYESNNLINDRFKFNSLQIYQQINNYIQKLTKDEQLKQKAKRSLTEQVLKFAGSIQPFISVQNAKILIHSSTGIFEQITNPNLTKMIKGDGVVVLVNEKGVRVVVERFE
ncbi:Hypothetical_protein [Hexamita inflata]|uniref:Hypothetical_protein n=1 Tax=Hexamita inflata TaxID=28002 RepID=A0AA86PAQ0_9EUKA|nr:Hypothetical protein HINF_LOCUS20167 [Hexamita inflata]